MTADGYTFYDATFVDPGLRVYSRNASSISPLAILTDRTDYGSLRLFGGQLYFSSVGGGTGGTSAIFRIAAPTAAFTRPAPLVRARGNAAAGWQ